MRWGIVTAVLALVAAGCAQEADSGALSEARGAGQAAPEPTLERYSTGVQLVSGQAAFEVVGTTLVGFDAASPDADPALLRSTDLGESWEPLVLPGAPDSPAFSYTALEAGEELAWVTGEQGGGDASTGFVADDVYLWASRNGVDWHGGRLPVTGSPSSLTEPALGATGDGNMVAGVVTELGGGRTGVEMFRSAGTGGAWVSAEVPEVVIRGGPTFVDGIWEADEGQLVAAVSSDSDEDELTVLASRDDGQSWQVGSCPDDSAVVDDDCRRVSDAGSLEVGPRGVSVNGEEWERPVLEPPPARGDASDFGFEEPIELPAGGWLVSASIWLNQEEDFGVLARSDDGVTWNQVFADDPCLDDDLYPAFTQPARLGAGWLVVHSCRDGATGSTDGQEVVWADLYVLDGAATEPTMLADTRQGPEYQQPVVAGDAVLVPVSYDDTADGSTEIVRLTP